MKQSYGILLYRENEKELEFFLVHPGGPFFKNKDAGWWTIPKGEPLAHEEPFAVALREFEEETGYKPTGDFIELAPITQKGGKRVFCWAVKGNLDADKITCNTFEMEWPPRSGKKITFKEIDHAAWFNFDDAIIKINERQISFITQLREHLI